MNELKLYPVSNNINLQNSNLGEEGSREEQKAFQAHLDAREITFSIHPEYEKKKNDDTYYIHNMHALDLFVSASR